MAVPFAFIGWDGELLSAPPARGARRVRIDSRCLEGEPEAGVWAGVCCLSDRAAVVRFDEPEVQYARREALQWWIPLLGDALICLTTIAVDASYCAGAITVSRSRTALEQDPFRSLFPQTIVPTGIFSRVPAPAGPVIERYAGAPWPGGHFPAAAGPLGDPRLTSRRERRGKIAQASGAPSRRARYRR